MDHRSIFELSAAGMRMERMRLDVTAMNIANMNTSRTRAGGLYRPLKVVAQATGGLQATGFQDEMSALSGPPLANVVTVDAAPRMVHEPGHPDADAQGRVAYPGVDHLSEMVNMVAALRAYEANVIAMNATRQMISKTLEIGGAA